MIVLPTAVDSLLVLLAMIVVLNVLLDLRSTSCLIDVVAVKPKHVQSQW